MEPVSSCRRVLLYRRMDNRWDLPLIGDEEVLEEALHYRRTAAVTADRMYLLSGVASTRQAMAA